MKTTLIALSTVFGLVLWGAPLMADALDDNVTDCESLMAEAGKALAAKNYDEAVNKSGDASACYRGKVGLLPDLTEQTIKLLHALADYTQGWSFLVRWDETGDCTSLDRAEDMVISGKDNLVGAGSGPRQTKLQADFKAADQRIEKGRKKCDAAQP